VKHKRENDERETKRRKREEARVRRSLTFSLQNWFSRTLSKWMEKIRVFAFSTHKIKKKENTHTHQKGKILSIPATSKVYIYARVKKTAYIKNGFYCALFEKSYKYRSRIFSSAARGLNVRECSREGDFRLAFFCFQSLSLSLFFKARWIRALLPAFSERLALTEFFFICSLSRAFASHSHTDRALLFSYTSCSYLLPAFLPRYVLASRRS